MKILTCEQYSETWWAARCGLPTASKFGTLITPTGKPSTQAKKYMYELIADQYAPEENVIEPTEWMIRGLELETEARNWLAIKRGKEISEVGLCLSADETYGASPDGLIDGLVPLEIKCPKASTHISYMMNKKELPAAYAAQVHGQMLATGSDSAVFVSYHPRLAPVVIDVRRDEYTAKVEQAVKKFVKDLAAARKKVK
jgi:putative phage-type endonuclease